MLDLENKTVLVTGAAKGIGRAIAKAFLAQRSRVLALDVDHKTLATLADDYCALNGRLDPLPLDLRNLQELKKLRSQYEVDILVNNAGIGWGNNNWQSLQQVNVRGPIFLTRLFGRQMAQRGRGNIIFITSIHSAHAFPGYGAYAATKGALQRYMAVQAMELAKYNVRVNAVAPGSIAHAGGTGKLSEEEAKEWGKRIPIGRLGEPEDIANVVIFLASPLASYIVGQEIRVDGGMSTNNNLGL